MHDVGPFGKFQKSMVVTNEPGISIPQEGFAIRIEDRVVVTAEGCRVLSAELPKEHGQRQSASGDLRVASERAARWHRRT